MQGLFSFCIGAFLIFIKTHKCQETFLMEFQKQRGFSPYQWAEYKGKIPHMKAFTVCYWEKLDFFNSKSHNIWSYCTMNDDPDDMECAQFWAKRDFASSGRNIVVGYTPQIGFARYTTIRPFKHRAWNHICWSYTSLSGKSRIYANGVLQGEENIDTNIQIPGSDEVSGSSFIIGQEPDSFRGGFDRYQAFRGNISEMNVWDYVLEDEIIEEIGKCRGQLKGNVIAWNKNDFRMYNISNQNIKDIQIFCKPEETMFVFPTRLSLKVADTLCKAHGGFMFTPQNVEENNQLRGEIGKYEPDCTTPDGSVFWLGAKTRNFSLLLLNELQEYVPGNYTNFNKPLFKGDFSCIHMTTEGKWQAEPSCGLIALCPVCRFIGTPIMTLKGVLI